MISRRKLFTAMAMAVTSFVALAPAAHADTFFMRYRGYRSYYHGRDGGEIRRRTILRHRLFDLADRVRLAERERMIAPRKANELYRDLDRVRDFLRNDRYLTDSEFDRRWRDLNDVAHDLRRAVGSRGGRVWIGWDDRRDRYQDDRWDRRYDDRYDRRYDDRYDRRYDDRYDRRYDRR